MTDETDDRQVFITCHFGHLSGKQPRCKQHMLAVPVPNAHAAVGDSVTDSLPQ